LETLTEYLQQQFGSAYEEADRARRAVTREAWRRRFVAYALKGIAVLGGLVLAVGLVPPLSQWLGFGIAAAVAVDGLVSNHMRLITTVKATQAYGRLLRSVTRSHQRDLSPILNLKASDPGTAQRQLDDLNARLLKELHMSSERIETALDEADLKALLRLSVEGDEAKPSPIAPNAP